MTHHYPRTLPPLESVRILGRFWTARLATNRDSTIPHGLRLAVESGRVGNFERAAAVLEGRSVADRTCPGYPFDDTDVYKLIEAAVQVLAQAPDPALEARIEEWVGLIARAQEPDGYLFTARTIGTEPPHPWIGSERFERETELSHELYNLAHLFEAAVAHFCVTGRRSLLLVAVRAADLLVATFGPGRRVLFPGHQNIEAALVLLARVTGRDDYAALAEFFLDCRGPSERLPSAGETYNQSQVPVLMQTEALGHAVRMVYMLSGMVDVCVALERDHYRPVLRRLFSDIVSHKLYITGGVGALHMGEAFGPRDHLPNLTAYNETCAAIGLAQFCQRMFLMTGDGTTMDVFERALYNGILSGCSLSGTRFFYPNPLESFGEYERRPWFGCACCPPNLARFLAALPGAAYAVYGQRVYVNLYGEGTAELTLGDGQCARLSQTTDYPWDGLVRIRVEAPACGRVEIALRIPGWARGEPVPSDLYRFDDESVDEVQLSVNREPVPLLLESGYAVIAREWVSGDTVELTLPMPVRQVSAHPRVAEDRGKVALTRGPIVYALEGVDQATGEVLNLVLDRSAPIQSGFRQEMLGGVVALCGRAVKLQREPEGEVSRVPVEFLAIPYFAWANRGRSEMMVWLPIDERWAWVRPSPTLASRAEVSISGGDCPRAANDQIVPSSSRDESHKRVRLEPGEDKSSFIEYRFAAPARVTRTRVYWFVADDWRHEAPPQRLVLTAWSGSEWRVVTELDLSEVELDRFQELPMEPVTTTALRLTCVPREGHAVGLLEWEVDGETLGEAPLLSQGVKNLTG